MKSDNRSPSIQIYDMRDKEFIKYIGVSNHEFTHGRHYRVYVKASSWYGTVNDEGRPVTSRTEDFVTVQPEPTEVCEE